jgi:hypothetical protein
LCGPDVTQWFSDQLPIIARYSSTTSFGDARYINLFKTLKFENANLASSNCPTKPTCSDTVTLCGVCISTSELGNLAYGYGAMRASYTNSQQMFMAVTRSLDKQALVMWGGFYAQVQATAGKRGFTSAEDVAAAFVGTLLTSTVEGSKEELCKQLLTPPSPYWDVSKTKDLLSRIQDVDLGFFVKSSANVDVLTTWVTNMGGLPWDTWISAVTTSIPITRPVLIFQNQTCYPCKQPPKPRPRNLRIYGDGNVAF